MTKKPASDRFHTFEQFNSALMPPFNGFTLQKWLHLGRKTQSKHPLRYVSGPDGTRYWAESDLVQYARTWLFRHKPELAHQFADSLAKLPTNT